MALTYTLEVDFVRSIYGTLIAITHEQQENGELQKPGPDFTLFRVLSSECLFAGDGEQICAIERNILSHNAHAHHA